MKNLNLEAYKNQTDYNGWVRFFLDNGFIQPDMTILDIGGATGNFLEMINQEICSIKGTVLETDMDCIRWGREHYPHIQFIHGRFPNEVWEKDATSPDKFDVVTMQSLFPHLSDWKVSIREMVRLAKQYINFSAIVRLNGATIADSDISYFYYMNTGERVSQVILNIWEIFNFLCIEEMRVKKIFFHGTHNFSSNFEQKIEEMIKEKNIPIETVVVDVGDQMHAFRGVPFYEQVTGNFTIELFDKESNPKRMGGFSGHKQAGKEKEYEFFMPDIISYIDGYEFYAVEKQEKRYNLYHLIKAMRKEM